MFWSRVFEQVAIKGVYEGFEKFGWLLCCCGSSFVPVETMAIPPHIIIIIIIGWRHAHIDLK